MSRATHNSKLRAITAKLLQQFEKPAGSRRSQASQHGIVALASQHGIKPSTLALAAVIFSSISSIPAANAQQNQSCSLAGAPAFGLRTPLIGGQQSSLPFMRPVEGAPPAFGDGACAAPVLPGHQGAPTLVPYNNLTPGGIGCNNGSQYIPFNPSGTHMPGQLGPSMQVPPPPSTPGCDPGMITNARDFYRPPVLETNVQPGGGLAGYAPTQRWGGQTTADFGRYKYRGTRSYDWGQQATYGQQSQDGPFQSLPNSQATQDLYGMRGYGRNGSTVMTIAPY